MISGEIESVVDKDYEDDYFDEVDDWFEQSTPSKIRTPLPERMRQGRSSDRGNPYKDKRRNKRNERNKA